MEHQTRSYKLGLFLVVVAALFAVPALKLAFFGLTPLEATSTQEIFILVNKGQNPNDVAKTLISNGIVADGKSLIWLGRLTRSWKNVKAGEYKVSPSMTPLEILSQLTSGVSAAHPVTVREGENMYEIGDEIAEKGLSTSDSFFSLSKNQQFIRSFDFFKNNPPPTLEGYFFPDTYFFNRTMTSSDMVRQMVKHFFVHWGTAEEQRAQQLGLTRHQVITLASMIEKETGAPEERPIISSVFHNRLRKKMKLQSDPTTIYGMWDRYEGKIHKSDLFVKNLYNTYMIPALPIGPIGNPGKEAIQAALYPKQSPFLYFVSHNDGTHQFSETFEEHNMAVKKYQLDPKARVGKSWRDHLKGPASVKK